MYISELASLVNISHMSHVGIGYYRTIHIILKMEDTGNSRNILVR